MKSPRRSFPAWRFLMMGRICGLVLNDDLTAFAARQCIDFSDIRTFGKVAYVDHIGCGAGNGTTVESEHLNAKNCAVGIGDEQFACWVRIDAQTCDFHLCHPVGSGTLCHLVEIDDALLAIYVANLLNNKSLKRVTAFTDSFK